MHFLVLHLFVYLFIYKYILLFTNNIFYLNVYILIQILEIGDAQHHRTHCEWRYIIFLYIFLLLSYYKL